MNAFLLALPIVIPLATAALAMLTVRRLWLETALGVAGALGLSAAGIALLWRVHDEGVLSLHVGAWPVPFGIVLVADLFSAIMVCITGVVGLTVTIYSRYEIDPQRVSFGYYPLFQILLMGVCGAFLTGDLFNLYVWFEVMLMASFVLLVLGGERAQMEGAVKYVVMNLFASLLFLSAVGLLYGLVGTLNFADLALKLREYERPELVTPIALLLAIAFGLKAAVFPLYFWLPASYHTPPVPITTVFSGLLTKVGVYSLVRVFTLIFVNEAAFFTPIFTVVAIGTMLSGVLGAVAQYDFRRLLSFHIISQIGYLIMGLALGTVAGLAALIYFLIHVILAKSALFLVSGIAHRFRHTYDLKQLGGLAEARPFLAVLFLVPALSLAGLPPFSGFFAKFALLRAGAEEGAWLLVAAALVTGMLTLFSMIKIWNEAFWKLPPDHATEHLPMDDGYRPHWFSTTYVPTVLIGALTLVLGLAAEPVLRLSEAAARQLVNPAEYIAAVGLFAP